MNGFLAYLLIYMTIILFRFSLQTWLFLKRGKDKLPSKTLYSITSASIISGSIMNACIIWIIAPNIGFIMVSILVIEALLIYGAKKISNQVLPGTYNNNLSYQYVCDDGDVVKSRGEAMVDNWLHNHGIEHAYERIITLGGKSIKYDWYLPEYDVYVEYWGFYGKKYKKRREEKEKLYQKYEKKLISINNSDIADINQHVKKKMLPYLDEQHATQPKRCFNCGIKLDERY